MEPFDRAQGRQEEREQHTKPLLPLGSSFKKRCGNFGHGTPWAEFPQHCIRFVCLLCVSSEAGGGSSLEFDLGSSGQPFFVLAAVVSGYTPLNFKR